MSEIAESYPAKDWTIGDVWMQPNCGLHWVSGVRPDGVAELIMLWPTRAGPQTQLVRPSDWVFVMHLSMEQYLEKCARLT
jgi:hypothetical protein